MLVQYIDRFGLSCTPDDNLINTIANSPPFCTASGKTRLLYNTVCLLTSSLGFALYYVLIGVTWFWLVHVVSTFYKVMWPFHARQHENKLKYVHAICLIIGIFLPLGPALGAFFIDGFGNGRFPPLLCVGRNRDVNYYGVGLPISLSVAIGMTLLIIILHLLQQVNSAHSNMLLHNYYFIFTETTSVQVSWKVKIVFFWFKCSREKDHHHFLVLHCTVKQQFNFVHHQQLFSEHVSQCHYRQFSL